MQGGVRLKRTRLSSAMELPGVKASGQGRGALGLAEEGDRYRACSSYINRVCPVEGWA